MISRATSASLSCRMTRSMVFKLSPPAVEMSIMSPTTRGPTPNEKPKNCSARPRATLPTVGRSPNTVSDASPTAAAPLPCALRSFSNAVLASSCIRCRPAITFLTSGLSGFTSISSRYLRVRWATFLIGFITGAAAAFATRPATRPAPRAAAIPALGTAIVGSAI